MLAVVRTLYLFHYEWKVGINTTTMIGITWTGGYN